MYLASAARVSQSPCQALVCIRRASTQTGSFASFEDPDRNLIYITELNRHHV